MSTVNPIVSVIVPCFNQGNFLEDALKSVLYQSYANWECIIVNDGSTDNTEEVAESWATLDNRIIYLAKPNGGLSSARNAGLRVAKGDFIQFLDADDVIDSSKFEIQLKELEECKDYALSISDYFSSVEDDLKIPYPNWYISPKFYTNQFLFELIYRWETELSIPVHCFLFKSALFLKTGITFNENLANHEDWDCWINIFKLNPEVKYVDKKLATYRIHSKSMCSNKETMKDGFLQAIDFHRLKLSRISMEYRLLTKKYNFVKYGISSGHASIVFLIIALRKLKFLIRLFLHR